MRAPLLFTPHTSPCTGPGLEIPAEFAFTLGARARKSRGADGRKRHCMMCWTAASATCIMHACGDTRGRSSSLFLHVSPLSPSLPLPCSVPISLSQAAGVLYTPLETSHTSCRSDKDQLGSIHTGVVRLQVGARMQLCVPRDKCPPRRKLYPLLCACAAGVVRGIGKGGRDPPSSDA